MMTPFNQNRERIAEAQRLRAMARSRMQIFTESLESLRECVEALSRSGLPDPMALEARPPHPAQLTAEMVHDFGNVLFPIQTAAQLLRAYSDEPEYRELVSLIEIGTCRGRELVEQILGVAREAQGQQRELDLRPIIGEIEKTARCLFGSRFEIETVLPAGLPEILGNAAQIHRVLLNLCLNARDAMPAGGRLTISVEEAELPGAGPSLPRGHFVRVTVADSGTGIPGDLLENIFEPYFTTKDTTRGTGLGLSSSQQIVRAHGGFMSVESTPGHGTTFSIHIPAAECCRALAPRVIHRRPHAINKKPNPMTR